MMQFEVEIIHTFLPKNRAQFSLIHHSDLAQRRIVVESSHQFQLGSLLHIHKLKRTDSLQ
ncbi:hypothetical protein PanWU01x14_131840 [Parasponia andersonii]|uniref:Uncharacterized protein n=1 Tax=Parasponia andersonii TaxID=3476 RepID=A0A2P5CQE4_PARAD|nr:hypothetical protein PanWU01x14_131840 [Parasponia andersonii]